MLPTTREPNAGELFQETGVVAFTAGEGVRVCGCRYEGAVWRDDPECLFHHPYTSKASKLYDSPEAQRFRATR